MVHEVLSPRVKNGNEAGLHPETLTRKFRERLGGGFEKDVIENLPVSQGKGIELVRQGEDDMEVLDGEELFPPCLDPLLFLQELTLRAVPVPARVVGYLEVAALLALVDVSPQICRSADLDGVHGAQVSSGGAYGRLGTRGRICGRRRPPPRGSWKERATLCRGGSSRARGFSGSHEGRRRWS